MTFWICGPTTIWHNLESVKKISKITPPYRSSLHIYVPTRERVPRHCHKYPKEATKHKLLLNIQFNKTWCAYIPTEISADQRDAALALPHTYREEEAEATFFRFYQENHSNISIPIRREPLAGPLPSSLILSLPLILSLSLILSLPLILSLSSILPSSLILIPSFLLHLPVLLSLFIFLSLLLFLSRILFLSLILFCLSFKLSPFYISLCVSFSRCPLFILPLPHPLSVSQPVSVSHYVSIFESVSVSKSLSFSPNLYLSFSLSSFLERALLERAGIEIGQE